MDELNRIAEEEPEILDDMVKGVNEMLSRDGIKPIRHDEEDNTFL